MAKDFIIDADDLLKLGKELQGQIGKFPNIQRKMLRTMSIYMVKETKKRFDVGVSPDGKPWKPLSRLTINARKKGKGRAGKGTKPLLSSGTLKRSIAPTWIADNEVMIGPGSNVTYASIHQGGASWIRTKRQAWWMVFNLWGFNPKKPGEFAENASAWSGWARARGIAKALEGSRAKIDARPFAGINATNINILEGIALNTVTKHILPKGSTG